MHETPGVKQIRVHLRTRDERHLASRLKSCNDQELVTLSVAERADAVRLLARDPHPESEKQRSRLIRLTSPGDRPRLLGAQAAAQAKPEVTAPHAIRFEPAAEILAMEWEAPPAAAEPPAAEPSAVAPAQPFTGLASLVTAVETGPSRPPPAVLNLRVMPEAAIDDRVARLEALEGRIAELTKRPLLLIGADTDYDEGLCRVLREEHAKRLAAVVVIGEKAPEPPLLNQVFARDVVEAAAKLARSGIVDRDGMKGVIDEATAAGIPTQVIRLSIARP